MPKHLDLKPGPKSDILTSTYREYYQWVRKGIQALKALPCMDCKINYPDAMMEFDHRDPGEKAFAIGNVIYASMESLVKELAKCDLVCRACHVKRTESRL